MKAFGRQLAVYRIAAGFETHASAVGATGLDRSRIARHENGTGGVPQRGTLANYEKAYGLAPGSLSELLHGGAAVSAPFTIVAEESPPFGARHARNLPFAIRKYLAEFRLRLTNADVPDAEIEEALELMQSPQLFTFYKGGVPSEYNEEEVLRGMKAIGEGVVVPELRDRGRKIP